MIGLNVSDIFRALDKTWAPARLIEFGPWLLRVGLGGGQRVSAASAVSAVSESDIDEAVSKMVELGQTPIFMIRSGQETLDHTLDQRGFALVDPVSVYAINPSALIADLPISTVTATWPILAVQYEIWEKGGIDTNRIAVMERTKVPKTALLARDGDAPAGAAYLAIEDGIAMLHALEVNPAHRRRGVAGLLVRGAANWAKKHGAEWLTVLVTKSNDPANALYRKYAMKEVSNYHYRRAPVILP